MLHEFQIIFLGYFEFLHNTLTSGNYFGYPEIFHLQHGRIIALLQNKTHSKNETWIAIFYEKNTRDKLLGAPEEAATGQPCGGDAIHAAQLAGDALLEGAIVHISTCAQNKESGRSQTTE